jgi:flagellar hook-basal body complex protein FliE
MALPITAVRGFQAPDPVRTPPTPPAAGEFRSMLTSAIQRVEKFQTEAARSVDRYLTGESEDLHTTALATQRAELALDMFVQARNKVVAAYQEIMRMQM